MTDSKPAFRPSILANLRAATERPAPGQTIRSILLEQIEPDPDQPRRSPLDGLDELAVSIRRKGVLQPIGVRKREGGYVIAFGERRWRAAKIAGLSHIPAFEVTEVQADLESQAIENQHRRALSNSDIASIIANMTATGCKNAEIAAVLNMPEHAVRHYRALIDLPPEIAPFANRGTARAVYEIRRAWDRGGEETQAAVRDYLMTIGEDGEISVAAGFALSGETHSLPTSQLVRSDTETSSSKPSQLVQDDGATADDDVPITNGSSSQHVRKTMVSGSVRRLNRPPYLPSDVREGLLEIARLVPEHIEVRAIIDRLIGGEGREQDAGKGRRVRGAGTRP